MMIAFAIFISLLEFLINMIIIMFGLRRVDISELLKHMPATLMTAQSVSMCRMTKETTRAKERKNRAACCRNTLIGKTGL